MDLSWTDLGLLDEIGFTIYEKKALAASVRLGVADAATLCREGDIPTSKIYEAMERLSALGVVEIQRTRPKLYSAAPPGAIVDRLVEATRRRAEGFATRAEELRELLERVPRGLESRQTFADLALGVESHVKRHLTRLAAARGRSSPTSRRATCGRSTGSRPRASRCSGGSGARRRSGASSTG